MNVSRRRLLAAVLTCLLVVAAGTGIWWWWQQRVTGWAAVTQLLPPDTERVAFTDWSQVRKELRYEATPSAAASERLALRATDRDLSVSSTGEAAASIERALGFNPVASDWEMLAQGPDGMVVIWRFDDLDADRVTDHLRDAALTEPKDATSGGVWKGGADVLTDAGVAAPEVQHVAVLEDEGLILASDDAGYLRDAVPVARGDEDGLDVAALADPIETPMAAVLLTNGRVCEELSTDQADGDAQATRDELVRQVGGVERLESYLVARLPGDELDVVFGYADDEAAEADRRAREALAKAEDPGQYLDYRELFTVRDARTEGRAVVVRTRAIDEFAPLTNLTSGPVLLATC